MKIGHICPYNITKGGGVQEIVAALQAELASRGHEVYIITPQPRDYPTDSATEKHVLFLGNGTEFSSPIHTTGQVSAGLNEQIDELLDKYQFDILHFHEPAVPMLSRQILSRSKTINVATFHAAFPETLAGRTFATVVIPYTKSVLKYIHELTAVSEAAAEYVCRLTEKPVALIPNGIDLSHYKIPRKRNDAKPAKTIFFVGRLENRKGVKYLLQAFHALQQEHADASLVIAGDGPDRPKLESFVADNGVQNVTFAGYVSDEEKLRYFQTADLFCSPALYGESFGVVLLEAMATGLVTVAGNNPGYASVMDGLGSVSLVNPKDTAEFASRLQLLLYENDLRDLWRTWAKEQISQYSYKAIADQYEEVYNQALEQHA